MTFRSDTGPRPGGRPCPGDVIAFPGAGSFGGEFRHLTGELGAAAVPIRYPGRVGKDFGTPAGSFVELVDAVLAQVLRRGADRPVLLGHSFGAYVAYAVADRLREPDRVAALVVTGATAPDRLPALGAITRDRPTTANYLNDLMPEPVPPEWQEVTVDLAMGDLRLLSDFRAAGYPQLTCPVHVARGVADPLTTTPGIRHWRSITTGPFTHRVFGGGHAHLLAQAEFTSWLRGITAGDATRDTPATKGH